MYYDVQSYRQGVLQMKKLTQSEYIKRCKSVWGDTYDLSKVEYINGRTKITIVCRRHGDFKATPHSFTGMRCGCPVCAGIKPIPTSEFLEKAKSIHGDKYGYDLVKYSGYNKPVKIVCREHGCFNQLPYVHLRGADCPKCILPYRLTTEVFIQRSKEAHGDKYTYELTEYKNATTKVVMTCPVHGAFSQFAHNHFLGKGCSKCGSESASKTKSMSLAKAIDVCSRKGISLVSYPGNASEMSELKCNKGHSWLAPLTRISSNNSGCPACSKSGYNPAKSGFVYILKSECGKFMKIGLSNNPSSRIKCLSAVTPFKFSRVAQLKLPGNEAPKLETRLHKESVSAGLLGFDGCTEWFIYDQNIVNKLVMAD